MKLFVPGRLCLFGEHTDWAGHYRTMNADIAPGAAIVTGIEQGIYAEVEKSSIFELYSTAPEIEGVWQDFSCRAGATWTGRKYRDVRACGKERLPCSHQASEGFLHPCHGLCQSLRYP